MRTFIRLTCLLVLFICIVLLLNIGAPNPTGRRYSSATPLTTGQGNTQAVGASAEAILAADLRLPRNEEVRTCLCGQDVTPPTAECSSCAAVMPAWSNYRRPDFMSNTFIAESKNRQNLLYSYSDQVAQISDYAEAAVFLRRPLFVYVRVDTVMSPEFERIVSTTGGSVVRYFTVPGYVDPVDTGARAGLGIALIVGVLTLLRRRTQRPPAPLSSPTVKALNKTNTAENYVRTAKARLQTRIDIEESRRDPDRD